MKRSSYSLHTSPTTQTLNHTHRYLTFTLFRAPSEGAFFPATAPALATGSAAPALPPPPAPAAPAPEPAVAGAGAPWAAKARSTMARAPSMVLVSRGTSTMMPGSRPTVSAKVSPSVPFGGKGADIHPGACTPSASHGKSLREGRRWADRGIVSCTREVH